MVVPKSKSQVISFVKRAGKKYKKLYNYTTDIGCSRKATVFVDRSRVILRTVHYVAGCSPVYNCMVIGVVKIRTK